MRASRFGLSTLTHRVLPSGGRVAATRAQPVLTWSEDLRVSEKVALAYFGYMLVASWIFPLSARERLEVVGLNLAATFVLLRLGQLVAGRRRGTTPALSRSGGCAPVKSSHFARSAWLTALRDWFPAVLILLAYREAGLLMIPDPTHRLDYLFVRWDSVVLRNPLVLGTLRAFSPWLQYLLEFSYLLCYPLVPLGAAAVIVAYRRQDLDRYRTDRVPDRFWTTVLLALFSAYLLSPFFPATPPRSFFHDLPGPLVHPLFRQVNLWILGQYGNYSNVFPSGHVAGATATALAVGAYLPRLGALFLAVAASIAIATVYGRYHYTADAVVGALIGVTSFLVSRWICSKA